MKSTRKPLNVGDMVKVYDVDIRSDVWLRIDTIEDTALAVDVGRSVRLVHRNQVYKVKRKVKKKATVFPKFYGLVNTQGCHWFTLEKYDVSKLTKKQRKLYGVPEGVK